MCSINGFSFKDRHLILQMNSVTQHRGPDATNYYLDESISLGHNRLSIIDVRSVANQPMISSDGGLVIVFNGEIYNFEDLRGVLQGFYNFKTLSDTEVILASYRKWGVDCFDKFNGVFAIAIWDKHKQELVIARDDFGVKPLYYYHKNGKFIFSSEIKGILEHSIDKQLNKSALNIFFHLSYSPTPLTLWNDIFKLDAGSYLIFKHGDIKIKKYVKEYKFDTVQNKKEALTIVRDGFLASVQRQMISDKPLGLYLSGGIDSTLLLSVMSKLKSGPIDTYSIGFDINISSSKYNTDFELARKTSSYYNSRHHEIILTADDIKNNFDKIVWHMDDLVVNHAQSAMFKLSMLAKNSVDVILSGDGGDELFAGYNRYYANYILEVLSRLPNFIKNNEHTKIFFDKIGKGDFYQKVHITSRLSRYLSFMSEPEYRLDSFLKSDIYNPDAFNSFMRDDIYSQINKLDLESTKEFQYFDIITWLKDDALNRVDKMSMAHGIELRVPFLDKELSRLALSIPSRYNLDGYSKGKRILRQSLKDYIPGYIYNQPKRGFFSPMAKWLRGDLYTWAKEILSVEYNPYAEQYLDFGMIDKIFEDHVSGKKYALNTIWLLLTWQVWYKQNFYE